jgi:hypothetical protein
LLICANKPRFHLLFKYATWCCFRHFLRLVHVSFYAGQYFAEPISILPGCVVKLKAAFFNVIALQS